MDGARLTAAERTRRFRARAGAAVTYPVGLDHDFIEVLVERGLLAWSDTEDKRKLTEALEALCREIGKGKFHAAAKG
jgi:hypothetical protein